MVTPVRSRWPGDDRPAGVDGWRAVALVEHEADGAEQLGSPAEHARHDLDVVRRGRDRGTLDRLAHRIEQQVAGRAQAPADDDPLRVEEVAEVAQALADVTAGVGDGALAARVALVGALEHAPRRSGPGRGSGAAARRAPGPRRRSPGSRGVRSGRSGRSRRWSCARSPPPCRPCRGTAGRRRPSPRRSRWPPSGRRGWRPYSRPRPSGTRTARRGWRRCRRGRAGRGGAVISSATRTPTQPGRIAGDPIVPVETVDRAGQPEADAEHAVAAARRPRRAPRRRARMRCPSRRSAA